MESFFSNARTIEQLRNGALGTHIEAFANWLHDQGYTCRTGRLRIRLAADFGNWVKRRRIPFESITPDHARRFLSALGRRPMNDDVPALKQFTALLRRRGVIAIKSLPNPTAAELLVTDFAQYLR